MNITTHLIRQILSRVCDAHNQAVDYIHTEHPELVETIRTKIPLFDLERTHQTIKALEPMDQLIDELNETFNSEVTEPPSTTREDAIRECVTWLTMNHSDYAPEFLAGYMASELLGEDNE